jgi:hypothetical protein
MKNTNINFIVSFEENMFTADATNAAIVTQAKNLDELLRNIKEAVELHNADEKIESPYFTLVYSDQTKS